MKQFNGLRQWNTMVIDAHEYSASYFVCADNFLERDLCKNSTLPGKHFNTGRLRC